MPKEKKRQLREIAGVIIKEESKQVSGLNIIFCSDEFIRGVNKEYLKHDYETDIITFHDMNERGFIEGELLISTDTVQTNSLRFKQSFENELTRVVIHGVLHLCGYNDKTSAEKKLMKRKENFYLKKDKENAGKSN